MDWSEVTGRVVVEACSAHPKDVVVFLGCRSPELLRRLAGQVKAIVAIDPDPAAVERARALVPTNVEVRVGDVREPPKPPGLSVVCIHDALRRLSPADQRALFKRVGASMGQGGLFIVGDLMWSMRPDMIDEPEQYGDAIEHVQETKVLEKWSREAGFLPDLHRFGPAVGVLIALKAGD